MSTSLVPSVPAPGPVLVGPAQAEREVEVRVGQQLIERLAQQPSAAEPVVVIAEPVQPVEPGQLDLPALHVGQPEVVEPELAGQMRLIVAGELRLAAGDVGPLGESLSPPLVVLGDRVELRQVERDRLDSCFNWTRSTQRDIVGRLFIIGRLGRRLLGEGG